MQGIKTVLSVVAFVLALMGIASKSVASPATGPEPWGEFGFGAVGTFAFTGVGFVPSSGGNSFFLDAPPWTFSGSGVLIVQDAFFTGDQFRVFDNGIAIGDTSAPTASTQGCGTDPVDCFADPRASRGIFTLGAGDHSFTIQVLQAPFFDEFPEGAGFLCIGSRRDDCVPRAAEVPEPSSMLLLAAGFLGAFIWSKRPELCRSLVRIMRKRERR